MEVLNTVKNAAKRVFNYVKKHRLRVTIDVVGLILFGTTLYCDIVSLYDEPPCFIWDLISRGKPPGMSILPPKKPPRYPYPVIVFPEPLSPYDWFSLWYPVIYLVILVFRLGVMYGRYTSKRIKIRR